MLVSVGIQYNGCQEDFELLPKPIHHSEITLGPQLPLWKLKNLGAPLVLYESTGSPTTTPSQGRLSKLVNSPLGQGF